MQQDKLITLIKIIKYRIVNFMSRKSRKWHPKFDEYMEFIATHSNYAGMPDVYKDDGSIRWVVTGNSEIGKKRTDWWKKKAKELGIPITGKWISITAKENHPTKLKICQTCGRKLLIEYAYPTKNLIKKLNKIPDFNNHFDYYDFKDIKSIINEIFSTIEYKGFTELADIFNIPVTVNKTEKDYWEYIYKNYVKAERKKLSPGAMSNAPDRFDGFHTYNICCRSVQDTGRHPENLARYNEDRRAYMHWSDGDLKAASWLMKSGNGTCVQCGNEGKVTPDHIGPISLGFAHLPIFQPFCKSCNSAKNNRMFLKDVKKLLELEKEGQTIISWHAKYIWDKLKNKVATENEAKKLSRLMRISHHQFLEMFYLISSRGYKDFLLQYLNPEYAFFEKIEFKNLNPSTYEYEEVIKTRGTKTQYHNNAARYIRIAYESLNMYHDKKNRKIINKPSIEYSLKVKEIIKALEEDETFNVNLRQYLESAFKFKGKKESEEQIKLALKEFEMEPYKNKKIDSLIKEAIKINSDILIESW
jgi:Alw26I/Eco31I/Esp3I family type II restriction endonuclease